MAKVDMICYCGEEYQAREADLRRGWGFSCGKSCAAKRRDFGLPKAKRADGLSTKKDRKKPSGYRPNDQRAIERENYLIHQEAMAANEDGWDGHKNSF